VPIYDYRCDHCGYEFSRQQRFDEEPVAACPNCGKRPRKLLSKPAIVFKGSGWHVTDYRKPGDAAKSESSVDDKKGAAKETPSKDAPAKDTGKKDATEKKPTTNQKEGPAAKSDAADAAAS
jgi:putative FmdB family regulatory protein